MKQKNISKKVKFWVDQDIIHCQIQNPFGVQDLPSNVEGFFLNTVNGLSKDKYMPLLIDFRKISCEKAIILFRFLSNSTTIQSAALSTVFLVRSMGLKALLSVYDFASNPIVPHKICINKDMAIRHCHKKNEIFNAIK